MAQVSRAHLRYLRAARLGRAIERREAQERAVHPTFSILCIDHGLSLKVPDLSRRCQVLTNHPHLTIFKSAPEVGPFAPPALAAPADALDLAVDDRVLLLEKLLSG